MIPEGPFKVDCGDGVQRTFHRSGVFSSKGFVYVNHRRVYGGASEVYTSERGYHYAFGVDRSGANAHLIVNTPEPEAAAV